MREGRGRQSIKGGKGDRQRRRRRRGCGLFGRCVSLCIEGGGRGGEGTGGSESANQPALRGGGERRGVKEKREMDFCKSGWMHYHDL